MQLQRGTYRSFVTTVSQLKISDFYISFNPYSTCAHVYISYIPLLIFSCTITLYYNVIYPVTRYIRLVYISFNPCSMRTPVYISYIPLLIFSCTLTLYYNVIYPVTLYIRIVYINFIPCSM